MKRRRGTKKKEPANFEFWLIHSGHWVTAFLFIFMTLTIVYAFFAGDPVFAKVLLP